MRPRPIKVFIPLAAEFFCNQPFGTGIIFYIPSSGTYFFHVMFSTNVLFGTLVLRAENEAPPLSIVQGRCIYTIFKAGNQGFNFRFYVLNLVQINISFCLSKVGSPRADLSAICATTTYWAGRYIDHLCETDKFLGPIYWSTAAKGLRTNKNLVLSPY